MSTKNFTTSFRIAEEIMVQLEKLAEETERSKSYHIKKAIEEYIRKYTQGCCSTSND